MNVFPPFRSKTQLSRLSRNVHISFLPPRRCSSFSPSRVVTKARPKGSLSITETTGGDRILFNIDAPSDLSTFWILSASLVEFSSYRRFPFLSRKRETTFPMFNCGDIKSISNRVGGDSASANGDPIRRPVHRRANHTDSRPTTTHPL